MIPKQWSKQLEKCLQCWTFKSETCWCWVTGTKVERKWLDSQKACMYLCVFNAQVPTRRGEPGPHHLHWALPGRGWSRICRHHQPHHPRLQVSWSCGYALLSPKGTRKVDTIQTTIDKYIQNRWFVLVAVRTFCSLFSVWLNSCLFVTRFYCHFTSHFSRKWC